MHLGLKTGPLCPKFCTKLEEPCSFSKFPDGPQKKKKKKKEKRQKEKEEKRKKEEEKE